MKLSDIRKQCDDFKKPEPWFADMEFIMPLTLVSQLLAVAEAALAHQQICEDQGESLQRLSEALWGVEE